MAPTPSRIATGPQIGSPSPDPLREASHFELDKVAIDYLVALLAGDSMEQQASTWILLDWLRQDPQHRLTQKQSALLLDYAHGLTHWQSVLHLFQMMENISIPLDSSRATFDLLKSHSNDEKKKFVRSWSYSGLAALALQHEDFRSDVCDMLDSVPSDGPGSILVRVRKAQAVLAKA